MGDRMTVFLVDDHEMVRLGLRTYLMLDPSIDVLGEASGGGEAIQAIQELSAREEPLPDLVLMDLMMPGMNGVEATRELIALFPDLKIVMLTSFMEDEQVFEAIQTGAVSYVLKTVSAEELVYALRGALKGMPVMSSEVSQALTRGLRKRAAQPDDEGLTEREKEVLLLIADGKTNKDISEELHISIKTVKTHVSNLLMKCELQDRTQLAVFAHRKGWVKSG
ncbi:response regulator [Paenibacillus apiarius]|uniref:Response regulator transcription factor n=1 Tax=Paenibacillus apiarius TaxID=46240 RepID=A0ABT4DT29_9BACL|nr:response regulator transcription factor [Paenibacillus apiarius]MCY9516657.1 response regulator transcription factor [Paenibacillus apiarius]MCY9519945.1 response regulator transcription factor [Paenibacillus apiarius]MCY9553817.1 response regulator transcription factor [Paenibacillus apiarius]MCY9557575.1 response regulator transcription factor [Paenibacillus apiarius]MCY9685535.1 response regulator transcription factor [Paenibacillus apiarius]